MQKKEQTLSDAKNVYLNMKLALTDIVHALYLAQIVSSLVIHAHLLINLSVLIVEEIEYY